MKTLTLDGYEPRTCAPTEKQRAEYSRDALLRLLALYHPTGGPLIVEHGTATLKVEARSLRPMIVSGAIAWFGFVSLPFAAAALGMMAFALLYLALLAIATLHLVLLLR